MDSGEMAHRCAPRLNALTGLRWWAAFAVFFFHMRILAPLPGTNGVFHFGNYGVMFFFILSGFVLTWSARPGTSIATFYVNRFARIWPTATVTLLLAVPVFYSFNPDPIHWWVKPFDLAILALSVVLIQGWWRDPVVLFSGNPAAWTLTIEFFFYSLHPFVNRALRLFTLRSTLVLGVVLVALAFAHRALSIHVPEYTADESPWPILRLNEFLLGMLVAHAMRLGWVSRIPALAPFTAIAAIVIVDGLARLNLFPGFPREIFTPFTPELLLIVLTLAIAAVAAGELRGHRSWFASKPIVTLGEWSFAFYLVHATVIYVLLFLFGHQSTAWTNVYWHAVAFVISLAVSAAVHLWVEKPLERRIRMAWASRAARRSEPELTA